MNKLDTLVKKRWFPICIGLAIISLLILIFSFVYLADYYRQSSQVIRSISHVSESSSVGNSSTKSNMSTDISSQKWNSGLFILVKESDSVVYLERKGDKLFYVSHETGLTYIYSYTLYRPKEDQYQDVYYLVSTEESSDNFFIKTVTEDGVFLDTIDDDLEDEG